MPPDTRAHDLVGEFVGTLVSVGHRTRHRAREGDVVRAEMTLEDFRNATWYSAVRRGEGLLRRRAELHSRGARGGGFSGGRKAGRSAYDCRYFVRLGKPTGPTAQSGLTSHERA